MKKYVFAIVTLLVFNISLYSQITTTIFPDGRAFKEFPFLNQIDKEKIPIYTMPSFDLISVVKEEKELRGIGGFPFRFGYSFDVDSK